MYSMRTHDEALEAHLDPHPVDSDIFGQRRMGDLFGAMDKVQQSHDEDNTQGSGSWSGLSDLSAEATDEFGRRLLQHHRDEKRLRDANRQPFRKARPKPRIAEAILREERERDLEKHHRVGSSGSNDSEQPVPVTLPREWGRKARRDRTWMRKIIEPSENGDAIETRGLDRDEDDNAIYPHKTAFTGDQDWEPATPSSMRHMNTTFQPTGTPGDDDFTSASLLASTPAPTSARPPRKIDELTRREIEDIERQGHASRVLDEIDQRSPDITLRRTSSSRLRERAIADDMASSPPRLALPLPAPAANSPSPPSRIPRRPRSALGENHHASTNGPTNGRVKSPSPTKLKAAESPRMKHNRNDSMNLLRKLARVSSMSPSPARERDVKPELTVANGDGAAGEGEKSTARRTSGWGSGFDDLMKEEPKTNAEPLVSTVPKDVVQPQPPAKSALDDVEQPQLPAKSVLEDIMRESHQYGESTIQSLEDIANPNVDPTFTLDLDETATPAAQEKAAADDALTQEQKDRRQEDLAMEGLNKHLNAARTSIKDASRGLRRVENRIEAAQESQHQAPAPNTITTTTAALPATATYTGFTHCSICGGGYHSVWYALWAEFRSLFYTYDSASRFGVRFTWLGAWCLGWLIWYMVESTLCSFYCKPKYAVPGSNFWGPSDHPPKFPFTIPMLIFRPWREHWEEWFDDLNTAVEAYFHELTWENQLDAASPHPPTTFRMPLSKTVASAGGWATAAAAETTVRVAKSLMDAVDEVGSMWDDEAWS